MRSAFDVESGLALPAGVARQEPRLEPAPAATARFWWAVWTTCRPYLTFVSGAAAAVGLAFTPTSGARAWSAFAPLFLSYAFGQALTDCFQTDTDALSSPYRPLVRGVLARKQVIAVSGVGLTASAAILAALDPAILLPAALAVAGLLAYTPLKRTWWGGPPCNAFVVALLPVMARMAEGSGLAVLASGPAAAAFWAATLAVLLGYADFVVIGYLKDISADRATGYRTFPVVFGWRAAVVYGDLLAVGSGLSAAYALARVDAPWHAWIVLAAAIGFGLRGHVTAHRIRRERAAHLAIVDVVRAFVVGCGAVVIGARPGWSSLFAAFYAAFELAIGRRPERTQV